jgi:FtsH-binding integral membrane protein
MSYAIDRYGDGVAANAAADVRAAFIRRTYGHLAGAILGFVILETILVQALPRETILGMVSGRASCLIVMLAFMGAAYLADQWARSGQSRGMQYAGLALYVVAEAIVFLPLIYLATLFTGSDLVPKAGILTLTMFGGLTFAVLVTGSDFSFLRSILSVGTWVALGIIVVGLLMGFSLGLWFSAAMVVLASGYILYDTSNVLKYYRTDQHVAAALALFASVALLFWYVLRILMYLSSRRS